MPIRIKGAVMDETERAAKRAERKARNAQYELSQAEHIAADLQQRLENGRHYLMGVQQNEITVEDALEAFGFGRNGLE